MNWTNNNDNLRKTKQKVFTLLGLFRQQQTRNGKQININRMMKIREFTTRK